MVMIKGRDCPVINLSRYVYIGNLLRPHTQCSENHQVYFTVRWLIYYEKTLFNRHLLLIFYIFPFLIEPTVAT